MLAGGEGAHWICLTQALSNIYSLYGKEAADRIGVFGIPGDDMQPNFDAGKTKVAMEFETAIKGAKCSSITQSLCLGELTAGEAAAAYDEDCRLQALQLGVLWD